MDLLRPKNWQQYYDHKDVRVAPDLLSDDRKNTRKVVVDRLCNVSSSLSAKCSYSSSPHVIFFLDHRLAHPSDLANRYSCIPVKGEEIPSSRCNK
ncbi:hypothetical protein ACLOJK_038046 [Asimina triloba]